MIGEKSGDDFSVEVAADKRIGAKQKIVDVVFEAAAEPSVERDREADLFAIDDVFRKMLASDFLDQPLAAVAFDFHRGIDTEGEFDQFVVEERRAVFDAGGHGHAVAAFQQVIGEPGMAIDVKHASEVIAFRTIPLAGFVAFAIAGFE